MSDNSKSAIAIIVAVGLMVFIGLLGMVPLQWRWLGVMVVFVVFLMYLGRAVISAPAAETADGRTKLGRWDGVLIDPLTKKISLARLQAALWTIIVLSAWATFALHRIMPVGMGRVQASDTPVAQAVAKLLAGDKEVSAADRLRAAAMLEAITGAEVTIADDAAAAAERFSYDSLAINIPQEVWLALGISTASLVGAGIIKANKAATGEEGRAQKTVENKVRSAEGRVKSMEASIAEMESLQVEALESKEPRQILETANAPWVTPSQDELAKADATVERLETQKKATKEAIPRAKARQAELEAIQNSAVGELHTNALSADARWSDMLRGDTIANFQFIDLGKVQMFFLTVILVFSYAALIWSIMTMPMAARVLQLTSSMSLPAFSESMIVIMALSHGGYLTTKATV